MKLKWALWPVVVMAWFLAGAGTGELALRAMGFSYYWALARYPDPVLGWLPAPHIQARQHFEGDALITTNGMGLRDREHTRQKPPETLRIAVLGDSFTAAVQVPVEQAWWRVMEDELGDCAALSGRRPDVLNFAVSGYSTAQELLMFNHRVRAFHPDVVLLAFFPGNDLNENLSELDEDPSLRPYYYRRHGALVLDEGFRETGMYNFWRSGPGRAMFQLLRHSRLLQAAFRARDVIRLWIYPRAPTGELPGEPGVDSHIYLEPVDTRWRDSWSVTEALISTLASQVAEEGARFGVTSLTTGAQVHPNPRFRLAFQKRLGVNDLFYPGRRLAGLAKREGFPFKDLAPEMQWQATMGGTWFHGFDPGQPGIGHWNPEGHRLAGELSARFVCGSVLAGP